MNREIKFRAWDGKKMFDVDVLALSPCAWDCPDYNRRGVSLAYQSSITVMQYTGLKDKHGKEIYEGDVVRTMHHIIKTDEKIYDDVVIRDIRQLEELRYCDEEEVIGNIHDNPELLEASE